MKNFLQKIVSDLRVELKEEFDKNFERKAFFSKTWKNRILEGKGSLMNVTGKLRRSIRAEESGTSIIFSSSEVYAAIHNEGGTIIVTNKMKKYFWAKYKQTGDIKYKYMAMKKAGTRIHIPQRQFIGDDDRVVQITREVVQTNVNNSINELTKKLKQ